MKIKISILMIAVAVLLQCTACGTKANDNSEATPPSVVSSSVESSDTAPSLRSETSSAEKEVFSSLSSRTNSAADKSADTSKENTSHSSSAKSAGTKSAASEAVSSKKAVSSSASSKAQNASKSSSKTGSSTSSAASQKQVPKTTVSSKAETKKTESTTTEIEKPKEEKTESSQPAESQPEAEPSSEATAVEEPVSSSPREWVKQHPPVEYDKSTLAPEVAPYAYPYDLEAIRNEMIAYGESLGMHYDDRLGLDDTNWSMYTMSADFRDPWEGYDINPSAFRDDCLGNISRIVEIRKRYETPPEWLYFNVMLLPDEEREGDFKVYVPYNVGDFFNYDEWYDSIKDQL